MKQIKAVVLSLVTVLSFAFASKAASPINTTKMENAVSKAVFNPTFVSINFDNSSLPTLGTVITAVYSAPWGNQTFSDKIYIDVTFYQWVGRRPGEIGENVQYHYALALYFSTTDGSGQAYYTGEYYTTGTNALAISSRPVTSPVVNTTLTTVTYPYCVEQ